MAEKKKTKRKSKLTQRNLEYRDIGQLDNGRDIMVIHLKYINESLGIERPDIIIFQKSQVYRAGVLAVAWKVIKDCGNYNYHPFDFPLELYVNVSDCHGNYTPLLPVKTGGFFKLLLRQHRRRLYPLPNSNTKPGVIVVENGMEKEAVSVNIFRGNRLLATQTGVVPGQSTYFAFNRSIFIGTGARIKEGEVINPRILPDLKQEISLEGISAADIIMVGGGPGPQSHPYRFLVDNIKN